MARTRHSIFVTAALQFCFALAAAFPQEAVEQPSPAKAATESRSDLDEAIAQCESLIEKYPNADFTPNTLFQLLELYYRKAKEDYNKRMDANEQQIADFEAGKIGVEPTIPRVSYSKVHEVGYRILKDFPTVSYADKILYRLAICHIEEGNGDRAIEFLEKLANEYTFSGYSDEAIFRIGEIYFDKREYETAISYFSRLMDSWNSQFFDMALYKLGWAYYNMNDYPKAISNFIFLIEDLSRVEKANQESLGKSSTDLRKEASRYVAECFMETGGAEKLEKFILDLGEKDYSQELFISLAEIYQERNFYEQSNAAYESILRLWPMYEKAPEMQSRIIDNYVKMDLLGKAERAREELIAKYGPGSEWLSKQTDVDGRENAIAMAAKNLYILATDAQTRAQESKSRQNYSVAIARYQEYMDKFPDSEFAAKVQFYQAECYYEIADYFNAGKAYEKVELEYTDSEFAPKAAYNRVIAADNLLHGTNGTAHDTSTIYIKDFLGRGETRPIAVANDYQAEMISACNDFARFFMNDAKAPEVMMKFGEILFSLNQYDMAKDAYVMVVNRGEDSPYTVQAYNMIAQSAFQSGDYLTSEKWYRRIIEEFADSTRFAEKAKTMIASAKFKLAQNLLDQGKTEYAAQAFENIAASSDNSEIAERALLQAAKQHEDNGSTLKAVIIYENLRYRFPKSSSIDESLYKAAMLAEKLPDYNRAAENYLELVQLKPNSVFAAKAMYNAALCYENLQDMERATQVYARYAKTYNDDPDRHLDALTKIADYAFEKGDFVLAKEKYSEVLQSYVGFVKQGKLADEYLPAQAQFKLAEIIFKKYEKIKLVEPIAQNLQLKTQLFRQVLAACQNAAKYKVADWTTAALYRIGTAYEEFAQAFVESPRPQGLDGNQLAEYEKQLQNKIDPLRHKALETYQQNIRMAEENSIQNEWVDKSRQRAEQLTLDLGFSNAQIPEASTQSVSGGSRLDEK